MQHMIFKVVIRMFHLFRKKTDVAKNLVLVLFITEKNSLWNINFERTCPYGPQTTLNDYYK